MTPLTSIGLAVAVLAGVVVVSRLGPRLGYRLPGGRFRWHGGAYYLATALALGGGLLAFHTSAVGVPMGRVLGGGRAPVGAAVTTSIAATTTALLGLAVRNRTWESEGFPGEHGSTRAPGPTADRRVWAAIAVVVFLAVLPVELVGWGAVTVEPYWLVAVPVGLFVLYNLAVLPVQPPSNHRFTDARHPTRDERERIVECYDRIEHAPPTIVGASGEARNWSVLAAGRIAGRYLWIHESLLAEASDDVLTAAIAIHEWRSRRGYFSALLLPQVVAGVAFVASGARFLQTIDPWVAVPLVLGVLAVTAAGLFVAGRLSRRAESVAVDAVGSDAVERAYDAFGADLTVVSVDQLGAIPLPRWLNPETPTAWEVLRVPQKPERRRTVPPKGRHWPLVGSPVFAVLGVLCFEWFVRTAHRFGLLETARFSTLLGYVVPATAVLVVLTSVVAAVGIYRHRRVAGTDEWTPHVGYYAVAVPAVGILAALAYLFERIYRAHWLWRPISATTEA